MNKITYLEATCPNCDQEMEVQMPEGVNCFKLANYNPEVERFEKLTRDKDTNSAIIEELYLILGRTTGWRNKKAAKEIKKRLLSFETINMDLEPEIYRLYNTINPPVGECSTD